MFHSTEEGAAQGGVISPTVANIVLDGMETLVKSITKPSDKINFVRYADDFIVTGSTREILEDKIKPAIATFLKERGLELSQEKTKITHVNDGFDFLGFNVRKYNGKMLVKPAKKNVFSFLRDVRGFIKTNKTETTEALIRRLNAHIRGWANYYRHSVSKRTYSYVDHCICMTLIRWAKRRHPEKNSHWVRNKYFRTQGFRHWIFSAKVKNSEGKITNLDLFAAESVKIVRHIKIRSEANIFDPAYRDYFEERDKRRKVTSRDASQEKRLPIF